MRTWFVALVTACAGFWAPVSAQAWGGADADALVQRGIARRAEVVDDLGLVDYRARAEGLVLFLTQFGAGFDDPPRLAKTDQLVLDLKWRFPGLSKQVIVGRRDRTDLPTDLRYHRDHLGIIQNTLADRIRLGDGHEVRDVPHPVSAAGLAVYEYAVVDSLLLEFPDRSRRLVEVAVRPIDPTVPAGVGSVYLDAATGHIVRLNLGFTRAAYRDDTVEDITILLEHALWEDRYWLPRAQIIEIRRHTTWFDFPARSIIRARWEIDDYQFNVGLDASEFAGPEITPSAMANVYPWSHSLDSAVRRFSAPHEQLDLDAARQELTGLLSERYLSGLTRARVGGKGVSDLARFNRVDGLTLGGGSTVSFNGSIRASVWAGIALASEQVRWRGEIAARFGSTSWRIVGAREVQDAGVQAVSGALNSIMAQEAGRDLGDYFQSTRLEADVSRGGAGMTWRASIGRESIGSLAVRSAPAFGRFRPNPTFTEGTFSHGRLGMEYRGGGRPGWGRFRLTVQGEAGEGNGEGYARGRLAGQLQQPVGPGRLLAAFAAGVASRNVPAHRSFVFGGVGTLPGEPFRAWGGRRAMYGTVEWQLAIPVPELRIASFVATGDELRLGALVGSGWSGGPVANVPWVSSGGARPIVGGALEWFHGLVRLEAGYGIRTGRFGWSVDVTQELWGIL